MIPRWKEELFANILAKRSAQNMNFQPSYSYLVWAVDAGAIFAGPGPGARNYVW